MRQRGRAGVGIFKVAVNVGNLWWPKWEMSHDTFSWDAIVDY